MLKTAIVTGAAGGIGFATVSQLILDGFKVAAMDMVPEDTADKMFEEFGDSVLYIKGDLSKTEDRENTVKKTVSEFGRIDALVNVAGVAPTVRADLLEMSEDSYDRVMGINTKGTMFLTQLAAKQMLKQTCEGSTRGYIVNISSMSAYTSSINRGEYCVSKAAVSMLTTLFADRLAADGILVNEIRPGIIATNMTATVKGKYDDLIGGGLLPIKRWGQPQDIADAISVLCSGKMSYVTGQVINVDGGFHIRRL